MKKSKIRKFIPWFLIILLFASAFIYVEIYGMSGEDVINRTANFWIPTCLLFLGCAVIHGNSLVDTIKKGDRLKFAIQIIQALIIAGAMVYGYMITIQIIPIEQQISECLSSDEYKPSSQLWSVHSDLLSKRNWTSFAAFVIVYLLEGCPYLVRKVLTWANNKRGEDQ